MNKGLKKKERKYKYKLNGSSDKFMSSQGDWLVVRLFTKFPTTSCCSIIITLRKMHFYALEEIIVRTKAQFYLSKTGDLHNGTLRNRQNSKILYAKSVFS